MSDLILLRARFCHIFMTMNKNSINLFVTSEFCSNFAKLSRKRYANHMNNINPLAELI